MIRVHFRDLQKVENVNKMAEFDLVDSGSGQLLSFNLSEEELINNNGYVKKIIPVFPGSSGALLLQRP